MLIWMGIIALLGVLTIVFLEASFDCAIPVPGFIRNPAPDCTPNRYITVTLAVTLGTTLTVTIQTILTLTPTLVCTILLTIILTLTLTLGI